MRRHLSAVSRRARALVVLVTAMSALAASTLAYADGIDISHWQGTVNWSKVKSDDVTFAFMKATEGSSYADPTLQRNWAGAEKVGIYRAAYHFARPSKGSAAAQARFFVSKAGKFDGAGDLPPVLDLEATGGLSPSDLRTWVTNWLKTVEGLTGRTPIIYFSPYFWIDHMGNSKGYARYPLWIAHYTSNASPMVPGGWTKWTFWQRTSSGHVDGISGRVDMNRFNGTGRQLAALAHASGGGPGPVDPGPTIPAGAATTMTMTPGTTTPAIDQSVTFTGNLSKTTPATILANRPVSLWSRRVGTAWAQVASGTTDGAGHYSLRATVPRSAAYQTRFAGDATYAPSVSTSVALTTPAQRVTKLFLRKDSTTATVAKGASLMLYGHLMTGPDGLAGQPVRYYKRSPAGGSWISVGSSTSLAPTGWHSLTIHPMVDRVWKAVYPGTNAYQPRTSKYLTVRVR